MNKGYSCICASSPICPLLSPACDHRLTFERILDKDIDKVSVQRDGQEGDREEKHVASDTAGLLRMVCFSGFPDTKVCESD